MSTHAGATSQQTSSTPSICLADGTLLSGPLARAAMVFCEGPLLHAVQCARIFPDSKTFVDMPLKDDPEVVLAAFDALPEDAKHSPQALRDFVGKWFLDAGSDCVNWEPSDFQSSPPFLLKIEDVAMREWASEINKLWHILGRQVSEDVAKFPQRFSMLPRSFPMIVPGGRFREMYYWDTYWIVRGLLICGMLETAQGIVQNLLDTVKEFGFFPNGGRIYYLDRSQPPLLTAMVREVHAAKGDHQWLREALPVLETEYRFWMKPDGGRVAMMPRTASSNKAAQDTNLERKDVLNIFKSTRRTPRPESYFEDFETAREASESLHREEQDVYQALSSGAESGWDYSTRWMEDATGRVKVGTADLSTIDTCSVVPVDLNCILFDVEKTLAAFHRALLSEGSEVAAKQLEDAATARKEAMKRFLWTGDSYRDFRLDVGASSAVASLSDWAAPLWSGLVCEEQKVDADVGAVVVGSLKRSGILRLCGCPVTVADTNGRTQWDAPNAWPPLMLMLIEGLDRIEGSERLADCLAETWLRSNYSAWRRSGFMHEKYSVYDPGDAGSGGEYSPQVGFGWTNGVVLSLLMREPRSCSRQQK